MLSVRAYLDGSLVHLLLPPRFLVPAGLVAVFPKPSTLNPKLGQALVRDPKLSFLGIPTSQGFTVFADVALCP